LLKKYTDKKGISLWASKNKKGAYKRKNSKRHYPSKGITKEIMGAQKKGYLFSHILK
jgi:hypothetical protein